MTLDELKIRLGVTDDNQDEALQVYLEDAIAFVKSYCHNDFKDGIPANVKRGIAILVESMQEDNSVSSRSLNGDLSESYFQNAKLNEAKSYFKSYRKVPF